MTTADLVTTRRIQGWTCHEDPKAKQRERYQAKLVHKGKAYTLKSSTWVGLTQAIEKMNERIL